MDTQYLKNVAIYIVSAIVSVVVIFFIGYHLFRDLGDDIETIQNQLVTVQETITLDAYIMKDETVLYSPISGGISALYADGEKVSANTTVVNIYSGNESSQIRKDIMSIDRKITLLQNSNIAENILISDTKSIDGQIADLYYTIKSKIEDNELGYVLRKTDDFLTLLNKRQVIVKTVDSFDGQILQLNNEKLSLSSKLDNISATVKTKESGYFYSEIDGYEEIFSSRKIDDMTLDDFYEMVSADADNTLYSNSRGYSVGKMVNDFYWYAACEITKEQLRNFNEGDSYIVIFPYNNDIILEMDLYRIVSRTDSENAVLILRSNRLESGFNFLRCQAISIIQKEYTGYKVPVSAVRVVDGTEGVYILDGNIVEFRKINTLYEADNNFIVAEKVEPGDLGKLDTIITKGKNLYSGKIVN